MFNYIPSCFRFTPPANFIIFFFIQQIFDNLAAWYFSIGSAGSNTLKSWSRHSYACPNTLHSYNYHFSINKLVEVILTIRAVRFSEPAGLVLKYPPANQSTTTFHLPVSLPFPHITRFNNPPSINDAIRSLITEPIGRKLWGKIHQTWQGQSIN